MRWYRKGADAGNGRAMNGVGFLYEKGFGVARDYPEAARWYRKAADAGNGLAMNNIGWLYLKGFGVRLRWYRKGADAGNDRATYNVAVFYENGWGVANDRDQAISWYRKALTLGYADAKNDLSSLGVAQ
jgi:TPR repeat protein